MHHFGLWRNALFFALLYFFLFSFSKSNAQVAPLGGAGSVSGNDGSFQYSIPIDVPPGRHNLAPSLALNYSSSGGNGFVGVGWNIPMSYVIRNTKYGVNYNCNPSSATCYVFVLGGASGELVPRTDWCSNCYGAKIESAFIQFQLINGGTSNAYWQAFDKSGTKYSFGQTSASRQDGTPGVFKWALDTVTDTNFNTITYSYFKSLGEIYFDHIDYQTNHIQFNLDSSRADRPTLYVPNFGVSTAYKLSSIDVYSNWTGSSGNLYKRYILTYPNLSNVTGQLLLKTVTPIGSDNATSLPPITLISQNGTNGFSNLPWSDTYGPGYPGGECLTGDINGDGRSDFWCHNGTLIGTYLEQWKVFLSNGTGWNSAVTWCARQELMIPKSEKIG